MSRSAFKASLQLVAQGFSPANAAALKGCATVSISLAILLLLLPAHTSTRAYVQQNAPGPTADRRASQRRSNVRELQRQAADLLARAAASQDNTDTRQILVDAAINVESLATSSTDGLPEDVRKEVFRSRSPAGIALVSARRSLSRLKAYDRFERFGQVVVIFHKMIGERITDLDRTTAASTSKSAWLVDVPGDGRINLLID